MIQVVHFSLSYEQFKFQFRTIRKNKFSTLYSGLYNSLYRQSRSIPTIVECTAAIQKFYIFVNIYIFKQSQFRLRFNNCSVTRLVKHCIVVRGSKLVIGTEICCKIFYSKKYLSGIWQQTLQVSFQDRFFQVDTLFQRTSSNVLNLTLQDTDELILPVKFLIKL